MSTRSSRRAMRWARCAVAGLVFLAAATPAAASQADTFGVLSRGVATAGAQTAAADDVGATYYNPAGLAFAGAGGRASVQLGYGFVRPFLSLDRTGGDPAFPAREPPSPGWITGGFVVPLGGKVQNRASLGVLVYHPQDKLIAGEMAEPQSPQFLRFANTDRAVIAVGLGVKLAEYLAIGAGANVLAGISGDLNFDVELFDRKVERRDVKFSLNTKAAPVLGVTLTPTSRWRIGLAYRGALGVDVDLPAKFNLTDVAEFDIHARGVFHYTPHQLTAGVQYEVNEQLKVMFDLNYSMWSRAPYPAVELDVKLGGEIVSGLGLDEVFNFRSVDPEHGFTDTVAPAIAAEYLFPDGVTRMRAGYAFRPTYVPNQVHESNFLDNNAHVLGLGATFHLVDPTQVFSHPLKLDVGGQLQVMQSRTVRKLRGGEPDFTFGGTALALGGALRYEFE